MRTKIHRDPGERSGTSCPTFTLETPEDYGLAVQRIRMLKAGCRDDAQDAELKGLEDAVDEIDTGVLTARNNSI